MNCKNCGADIAEQYSYCGECGGRIVEQRFTMNSLASEAFGDVFGWDSRFWDTFLALFQSPRTVIQGYLDGERGRFMNPFSFYAFLLSISVILMTVFQPQIESLVEQYYASTNLTQYESMAWLNDFLFTYQALVAFLIYLPLFTLMSFISFRKPYNFSEHLIINVFAMSLVTALGIFSILIFLSLNSGSVYIYSTYFVMFAVYIYVYQSLYKAGFKKWLFIILRFLGLLFLLFLIPFLIGIVIAIYVNTIGA